MKIIQRIGKAIAGLFGGSKRDAKRKIGTHIVAEEKPRNRFPVTLRATYNLGTEPKVFGMSYRPSYKRKRA